MSRRVLLVGAATVATLIFLFTVPTFREFFDLGVYRGAVRHWLLDGGDLYEFRYQGTEYGFTYPPFAALVFSPLSLLSWPLAVALSLLLNAAAAVVLLRWFGFRKWMPVALGFLAIQIFEPARDTVSFGQVNLVLMVLVLAAMRPKGPWTAAGIGLATAIKLTPAVFIGYLIVTRRYKEAAVASGTAVAATLLAVVIAPDASRTFWTQALWDTDRVGRLEYVSNQSLRGVVARLDLPSVLWPILVLACVAAWFVLVRRTDRVTGFALTGILACLISPVTWVHHLVWLLPALFLLMGRRPVLIGALSVVLSSSVVFLWWAGASGPVAAVGANTYVWISLLLAALLTVKANGSSFTAMNLSFDDNGTGPLIVCLPGMGDNRQTYRELTPLLVAAGHRVVTVDPRGQGESPADYTDYSPEATGADVLELIARLDAGPATLVTNSYTGASAIWAAASRPAAFDALVLIGPFARQMPTPPFYLRAVLALLGRSRRLWMMYWSTLFKARRPSSDARDLLSAQLARPGRMAVLRAQFAADKSVAERRTPEVSTPSVVVMGSKDPDFPSPAEEGRLIADRLKGELVMIEGAGHYPQYETPDQVAAAVLGVVHRARGTVGDSH